MLITLQADMSQKKILRNIELVLHPHVNEKFREEKGSFLFNPIACMHLSIGTPLLHIRYH